jgi:type VI protein secretion system component Hcp
VATEHYINVDGVDGGLTLFGIRGWMNVGAASFGPIMNGPNAPPRDVTISRVSDLASPKLYTRFLSSWHVYQIVLYVALKPTGRTYTFDDCFITDYSDSGSSGEEVLMQTFTFKPSKVTEDWGTPKLKKRP